MSEQTTYYVVQRWIDEPYSYWTNCAPSVEGMFALPNPYFETEQDARAFLDDRRAAGSGKLRLVRQVTTLTEI